MLNLLYIELYKIFHQRKIYIFYIIIMAFSFLFVFVTKNLPSADGTTIPLLLLQTVASLIIPIFTIIFQTDLFISEFRDGNMKLLLTRPISRPQLFFAKVLCLLVLVGSLYLLTFILSYILGGTMIGFHMVLDNEGGWSMFFNDMFQTSLMYLVSVIPMLAFGLLVGILAMFIKSNGTFITVSIIAIFAMSIVGDLFKKVQPYMITTYFTSTTKLLGDTYPIEHGIWLGWAVVLSYILFSGWLCYALFLAKDIEV